MTCWVAANDDQRRFSVARRKFWTHKPCQRKWSEAGFLEKESGPGTYLANYAPPARTPVEQMARAAVVPARSEPASSVEAHSEEQGVRVLRSPLSAVLSCLPLTAVVAAVGSDLQDLQDQIEPLSSLEDALMCISDVVQIVEILHRFLEHMQSWAAKRGLDTAEGFCGPPVASGSSPPSAMAGGPSCATYPANRRYGVQGVVTQALELARVRQRLCQLGLVLPLLREPVSYCLPPRTQLYKNSNAAKPLVVHVNLPY